MFLCHMSSDGLLTKCSVEDPKLEPSVVWRRGQKAPRRKPGPVARVSALASAERGPAQAPTYLRQVAPCLRALAFSSPECLQDYLPHCTVRSECDRVQRPITMAGIMGAESMPTIIPGLGSER